MTPFAADTCKSIETLGAERKLWGHSMDIIAFLRLYSA